jgi:hypothetical protein
MKQHITQKQLDELKGDYPKIEKISEWIHDHGYKDEGFANFFTIGRMIEFLGDSYGGKARLHMNKDMCDALWEAVKKEL